MGTSYFNQQHHPFQNIFLFLFFSCVSFPSKNNCELESTCTKCTIDLLFQQGFIRHNTIFCKEAAAQTYHGVRLQELLAEQDFIQLIAGKPCRLFIVLDFDSPPFFCFSRAGYAPLQKHGPACPGFPGNAVRFLCCPGCPCAGL